MPMADESKLQARVDELEETLRLKDRELQKYRSELTRTNQSLEKVIAELSQELSGKGAGGSPRGGLSRT